MIKTHACTKFIFASSRLSPSTPLPQVHTPGKCPRLGDLMFSACKHSDHSIGGRSTRRYPGSYTAHTHFSDKVAFLQGPTQIPPSVGQQTHLQHCTPEGCPAVWHHLPLGTDTHSGAHARPQLAPRCPLACTPLVWTTCVAMARCFLSSMVNQTTSRGLPGIAKGLESFHLLLDFVVSPRDIPPLHPFILEAAHLYVTLSDTGPDLP